MPAKTILQQDAAPLLYSRAVRDLSDGEMSDAWIGRGGPINWLAQSPDVTSIDLFLCDIVKNNVSWTSRIILTQFSVE